MYARVPTTPRRVDDYRAILGEPTIEELRRLAAPLAGSRVLHLTMTAFGGGAPEELAALQPLMNDLGIHAEWQVVRGSAESARLNTALENALGGLDVNWGPAMAETWKRYNAMNATIFDEDYDFTIVHDALPAGLPHFVSRQTIKGSAGKWLWHCHGDLTAARREVWEMLRSYLDCCYDATVFAAREYVRRDFEVPRLTVMPPAIDPLSPKNISIDATTQRHVLQRYGIDPNRPVICQIARFAKWGDPLGVIEAYQQLKRAVPELQLVLVSALPGANAQASRHFQRIVDRAGDDPDIHVFSNLNEVGNIEQNIFGRAAQVVLYRSQRKGFATAVSEASWKHRPVVADHRGIMPGQVVDNVTGYIVDSVKTMAERVQTLLQNAELAHQMGVAGHDHVRHNFLITRTLRQYLILLNDVIGKAYSAREA